MEFERARSVYERALEVDYRNQVGLGVGRGRFCCCCCCCSSLLLGSRLQEVACCLYPYCSEVGLGRMVCCKTAVRPISVSRYRLCSEL